MTIDVNKIYQCFSKFAVTAKLYAALFSDTISAIEDIEHCKIFLRELSEVELGPENAICLTQEIQFHLPGGTTPARMNEHFIFISRVNRKNINLVRFAVAHELGHIVLHHKQNNDSGKRAYTRVDDLCTYAFSETEELEADAFALCLLASKGKVIERETVNLAQLLEESKELGRRCPQEIVEEVIRETSSLREKKLRDE